MSIVSLTLLLTMAAFVGTVIALITGGDLVREKFDEWIRPLTEKKRPGILR